MRDPIRDVMKLPNDVKFNSKLQVYVYTCSECHHKSEYVFTRDFTSISCGWCRHCKKWRDENSVTWKCEDGRFLLINEMETSHIQACVGMIINRHNWRQRFMRPLLLELEKRLGERQ